MAERLKTRPVDRVKVDASARFNAKMPLNYKLLSTHRHMSLTFLFICLILVCFGLLMMFSASYGVSFIQSSAGLRTQLDIAGGLDESSPVRAILEADATALARKQVILTVAGTLVAIFIGACVRFRQFTRPVLGILLYLLVTVSLVYCRVQGTVINGARRWINLGSNSFQPSELAKIGAVFFLAGYFSHRSRTRKLEMKRTFDVRLSGRTGEHHKTSLNKQAFLDVTWPALLVSVWIVLTLIQPHLSGAVIIALVSLVVFFLADIPLKSWMAGAIQLVIIVVILSVAIGFVFQIVTKESTTAFISDRFSHVFRRVGTFQDRAAASEDDRLQIEQAEIALGSGGLTGKGLGKSVQKLNWLSEAHNDFILPVIGEELGFIGVLGVVVLFLAFLVSGLMVAKGASTQMAMLVAAGNTILISIQAFLNMAVAASLIPATGISLPFFSYGGTANIFFAVAAGLVLCVSKSATRCDRNLARIVDPKGGRKARKALEEELDEEDVVGYAV